MGRWWLDSALIGFVLLLGLLQGSRAALGDMPLRVVRERALAPAAAPALAETEPDALRGHFYRPPDSTAVRPALRLTPGTWEPGRDPRADSACLDSGC
jgi:hypothetical protein